MGRQRARAPQDVDEALYTNLPGRSTPRGLYRWVVAVAHSRVSRLPTEARRDRALDLAQFGFIPFGVSLRVETPAPGATKWVLTGMGFQNRVWTTARVDVSAKQMAETKVQLQNLVTRIAGQLEIGLAPPMDRRLKWDTARHRYVMTLRPQPWTDLVLAHCAELAARFPAPLAGARPPTATRGLCPWKGSLGSTARVGFRTASAYAVGARDSNAWSRMPRVDIASLRALLRPHIEQLALLNRHADLPAICEDLGLPAPDADGSKRQRLLTSFDSTPDTVVARAAQRYIDSYCTAASVRNDLQEALWNDSGAPDVPKRSRHDLARALDPSDLVVEVTHFDALLRRLFVLDDWSGGFFGNQSLAAEIKQHVYLNPGDWSVEHLLERLGAFECSSRRFILLVEGLASADVRRDEHSQRRFVALANEHLRGAGVELRETDTDGGYPVFTAVPLRSAPSGKPKNIIFASAEKPDIRLRDAVTNDIEIVTNAERVLVYDVPIGPDGLRWHQLQAWWMQTRGIRDPDEGKRTLYRRLQECLPETSPPQRTLFRAFFEGFGPKVPNLPALLPEIWLHWDARTVKERGFQALTRLRMDFLLLLPVGVRIVVEVDGAHHYANTEGRADVSRYATMMAGDRDLRLAGYDVFRFGAAELSGMRAAEAVMSFFTQLFKRYGVSADA